MATARQEAISTLIHPILPHLWDKTKFMSGDPQEYVVPEQVNATMFAGQPVVDTANVSTVQSLTVNLDPSQISGPGGNIQGQGGGGMAGPMWKFVATIKAGDRGKTTSIYWKSNTDIKQAIIAAGVWLQPLSDTMGNEGIGNTTYSGGTAKSPKLAWLKVTDAQNPRYGQLVELTPDSVDYYGAPGPSNGSPNNADFISSALSLRLHGVGSSTVDGQTVAVNAWANHALYGVPDSVVANGDQVVLTGDTYYGTYDALVKKYLTLLTDPSGQWGIMAQDPAQKPLGVTKWDASSGNWVLTITGHGYANNDRIRLTGCDVPGWNGSYKVTGVTVNTVQLVKAPPISYLPTPTAGKAQRYQLATGVRCNVFCSIVLPPGGLVAPYGLKVAKRNPGRTFTGVSFRRRPRKIH